MDACMKAITWRFARPMRVLRRAAFEPRFRRDLLMRLTGRTATGVRDGPERARAAAAALADTDNEFAYAEWIRQFDTISTVDRAAIEARVAQFPTKPLISVIVPVYNTPKQHLISMVESLRAQFYP